MNEKYKEDGVDIAAGDQFSEFAGKLCRDTFGNSIFASVQDFSGRHFRGPRGLALVGMPEEYYLDMASDGDGTKVVITSATEDYFNAARGWVAMTGGDITRWGGVRIALVNNLDVRTLGEPDSDVFKAFKNMMIGLKFVADEQGLIMFKGETAELGHCIGSENPAAKVIYTWSGVCLGAYNPKTVITGDNIRAGMVIIALREKGFRNNGISSVRKAGYSHYAGAFYTNPEARADLLAASEPAVLYDNLLEEANGWFSEDFEPIIPVKLLVHATGGAIKSKLAHDILFPRGFSAVLDDLWDPPEIMRKCAEWRGLDDEEFYAVWNGGQGEYVVLEKEHAQAFIDMATKHGIEAKVAGEITQEKHPRVTIHSKLTGKEFFYRQ